MAEARKLPLAPYLATYVECTMSKFDIIYYKDEPEKFLHLLNKLEAAHLPSKTEFLLHSNYYQQYYGKEFTDTSILALRPNASPTLIQSHCAAGHIGNLDTGAVILTQENQAPNYAELINILKHIQKELQATHLSITEMMTVNTAFSLSNTCLNNNFTCEPKFYAMIDLSQNLSKIKAGLRKSYKSLISKGMSIMNFKIIDRMNPDFDGFESFRLFHKQVAGRETRPLSSWQTQYEMIKNGVAELILGYIEGHGLVSGGLYLDYGRTTSYSVGVFDRDLFHMPLAHANTFLALQRAKERKQSIFKLGEIYMRGHVSDKEYNIGFFKKGFCNTLTPALHWTLALTSESQDAHD